MTFSPIFNYINDSHLFFSADIFNTLFTNSYQLTLVDTLLTNNTFNLTSQNTNLFYTQSLITFINQTEDINLFNNLENTIAVYHYSIPNTKLAYPEPFIASPSFMHTDLWFIHILVYQYWLWFVFVFIIVFFFLMFICTIRWCNMRIRPRRETRGVSRSKCGDLVTACVPVTWATSIIVNESTDAIDYYDGFGTTELVVGIRAYQWGWEYYYPKDIDLNYNVKPNYSLFLGNSLKYNRASEVTLNANNLWKFYQNKTTDHVITPAHALVLPLDNFKLLNFLNFSDLGANSVQEQNSFKRIRMFSKIFTSNLTFTTNTYHTAYQTFNHLYADDTLFSESYLYGMKRQHNFLSISSMMNNNATFLDLNSLQKFLNYNWNHTEIATNLTTLKTFFTSLNSVITNSLNFSSLQFNNLTSLTAIIAYYNNINTNAQELIESTYWKNQMNWNSLCQLNEENVKNPLFDYPYSPIRSNHPVVDTNAHAKASNLVSLDTLPSFTSDKTANLPQTLTNVYFNLNWTDSKVDWKLYNVLNYHNFHQAFYFPMFNFYYDYDFRNWQAIELVEDSFWESVYSIYNHDEYAALAEDFYNDELFDKVLNQYNMIDRLEIIKDKIVSRPMFTDTNVADVVYANTIYTDDYVSPANLVPSKDFFVFPLFSVVSYMDDSYESLKYLNYLFQNSSKLALNFFNFNFQPHSSLFMFDAFRADYEDFSWFTDENNSLQLKFRPFIDQLVSTNFYHLNETFNDAFKLLELNNIVVNEDLALFKTTRFNNHLNLRAPAKNAIVNYNALQKVFRARFDEGRSNAKLTDLGSLYTKQPFISSSRIAYESLLGKTKESFVKVNMYKNNYQLFLNTFYELNSSLNFYFYDFPFLIAMKSDASRYLWFDWFAKWGMYEVQPSSSSRYAIYGMPYLSKNFEFNTNNSEAVTESETYLLRISRARKNYLPNWTYSPYFYAKNTTWYRNNLFYEILTQEPNSLTSTVFLLNAMNWYWTEMFFISSHSYQFFPSSSGLTSYTKLGWKPQSSIQSYYYTVSTLIDILTKREYLYRELLSSTNKIINLPLYLTNSVTNPLVNDIKASFLFIDPVIYNNEYSMLYNNEYSRETYFNSLQFFNFIILKALLSSVNDFMNISLLSDYLFYYFFNPTADNLLQKNAELYKNQYRPLRKGVSNMIRLHATGAIAMPIEIRLQIMASSKDVIHSWAIPSAGIKMDCIPGYSSHKVFIFLVSGIFWGQCMEICGRYHHWMPIVVYFMKRDLFFLWCTHFVFLTGANNMWNINDRQFVDYLRVVSFDKYSWLSELSR